MLSGAPLSGESWAEKRKPLPVGHFKDWKILAPGFLSSGFKEGFEQAYKDFKFFDAIMPQSA